MVDPDPIMKTSRDTESENGNEVLSQSKPNCIGLRECRKTKQTNTTETQEEQILLSNTTERKGDSLTPSQPEPKPTERVYSSKKRKSKCKTEETFEIGDNVYVRPPSIHDKYAARPDSLEHICLAQFFIWYESVPKNSKNRKKKAEYLSEHQIICPHLETPMYMPNHIQLNNPELGCMYLRERPVIMMFHKYDAEKDAHDFFYTELLFYFHWRCEDMELQSEDFTECLAKFKQEFTAIETVKTQLFPKMNNVELARTLMEENPKDIRPSCIGDLIDNQNEQEEAEQQFEGEQPDPEYEVRGYDGNLGCENASEQSIFKIRVTQESTTE